MLCIVMPDGAVKGAVEDGGWVDFSFGACFDWDRERVIEGEGGTVGEGEGEGEGEGNFD
jgi:hypothetical protein